MKSIINMASEAKNASEAVNTFSKVIHNFISDPLDEVVNEGYKSFLIKVIETNPTDPELLEFISGYKQLVKQERRKKNIAQKAMQFLEESAKPQDVSEGWFDFFFEKAKLVSDGEMILIWSKVLAEEANYPGKISPSLLHTLSVMTHNQAEFFCNISRFALRAFGKEDVNLLIFVSSNREAYLDSDITPRKLKEIERLGLIDCDFKDEFVLHNKIRFTAGNNLLTVFGDPNNENKIKSGNVEFTSDGKALYDIIDISFKRYRKDILDFTINKLIKRNCKVLLNDREIV